MGDKGYVLVWDLDQTIIGNYFDVEKEEKEFDINTKAIEILKKAVAAREKGVVKAIFLLTNNSDIAFIIRVIQVVNELVFEDKLTDKSYVFDEGLPAGSPLRVLPPGEVRPNYALKRVEDVKGMMDSKGFSTDNLVSRIFFFDDIDNHVITEQLTTAGFPNHFIHITPPYKKGKVDTTNWSAIEEVLDTAAGGRRKTRRRKIKKTKKQNNKLYSKRRI